MGGNSGICLAIDGTSKFCNSKAYKTFNEVIFHKIELQSSQKTQAKFYKKLGKRTDMFGIGAIAFNLITCGESPERFYESMKIYDTSMSTVAQLINAYEKVAKFESDEPGLVKIFEPFKNQNSNEYAPKEIVELILKCMLYKSLDNFYYEGKAIGKEPTEILLERIKSYQT